MTPLPQAHPRFDHLLGRFEPSTNLRDGNPSEQIHTSVAEPQDVFLQQAWKLTDDGTPDQAVPGSRGLLLRQEDVEVLELIDLEVDDGKAENR